MQCIYSSPEMGSQGGHLFLLVTSSLPLWVYWKLLHWSLEYPSRIISPCLLNNLSPAFAHIFPQPRTSIRVGNLPSLQANKLACCCFINAGRRCGIPELETKDLTLLAQASSVSIIVTSLSFVPKFHGRNIEGPRWMLHMKGVYIIAQSLGNTTLSIPIKTIFIVGNKQDSSLSGRCSLIPQSYWLQTQHWEMSGEKAAMGLHSWHTQW